MNKETSRMNFLINCALIVTVAMCLLYYYSLTVVEKEKLIEKQEVVCLTAVCVINKEVGDQCYELQASLALISVAKDANHSGGKRLLLEPSLKSCGLGNGEERNGNIE